MRGSYFSGRNPNVATIRLRVPVGIIYPEQLDTLKEVANRYGDGRLHLTVRKTIEIPSVPKKHLAKALACLSAAGWYSSAFGNNVRNIIACPGRYSCPNSQIDTQSLGLELDSSLADLDNMPAKVKIAISGCSNGCTHPLANDIGIVGVSRVKFLEEKCQQCYSCIKSCRESAIQVSAEGKVFIDYEQCIDCGECLDFCGSKVIVCEKTSFRIYLGGKMGRHPRFGRVYGDFVSLNELLQQVEKIVAVYSQYGLENERLGDLIERISLEQFAELVANCIPPSGKDFLSSASYY